MSASSSHATKSVTYWPVSHGVRQPPAHTWTRDDLERNIFCGLNAAGTLNIAMFAALRRVSIMMTLIAQWWFLNQKSTRPVIISIVVMVGGSFVAALDDLAFDARGYLFAMTNNLFTAASQIAG